MFNTRLTSRIVGVSLRQLQYWDEQGFVRPSVRCADGRGSKRLYSFSDLIQLKLVKNLIDRGLTLQSVRRSLDYLRRHTAKAATFPHSVKYLTDGDKLFMLTSDRRKILDTIRRQFVLSFGFGDLVRELNVEVGRLRRRGYGPRASGERPLARRRAEV